MSHSWRILRLHRSGQKAIEVGHVDPFSQTLSCRVSLVHICLRGVFSVSAIRTLPFETIHLGVYITVLHWRSLSHRLKTNKSFLRADTSFFTRSQFYRVRPLVLTIRHLRVGW